MKNILCFGDSNTYGYIPATGERYDTSIRWTGRLSKKANESDINIIEEGLVGRTTVFADNLRPGRRGVDYLPVALESHYPLDAVVLMLGTNDCKTVYGASAKVIGKGIEKLIKQIKTITPNTKIILISPIHLGDEVWKEEYDPEFNENSVEVSKQLKKEYQRLATHYGCEFLAASDVAKPSHEDQEHLTEKGHQALADAVWEKLKYAAIA